MQSLVLMLTYKFWSSFRQKCPSCN